MADAGRLGTDPLFLGLTRPPMMLGVTYSWFVVNAMIWTLYFINFSSFAVLIPGASAPRLVRRDMLPLMKKLVV